MVSVVDKTDCYFGGAVVLFHLFLFGDDEGGCCLRLRGAERIGGRVCLVVGEL